MPVRAARSGTACCSESACQRAWVGNPAGDVLLGRIEEIPCRDSGDAWSPPLYGVRGISSRTREHRFGCAMSRGRNPRQVYFSCRRQLEILKDPVHPFMGGGAGGSRRAEVIRESKCDWVASRTSAQTATFPERINLLPPATTAE